MARHFWLAAHVADVMVSAKTLAAISVPFKPIKGYYFKSFVDS